MATSGQGRVSGLSQFLFGLGTWRRAVYQYGVAFSMAVRGWHVSDRAVRGSGARSHSKT